MCKIVAKLNENKPKHEKHFQFVHTRKISKKCSLMLKVDNIFKIFDICEIKDIGQINHLINMISKLERSFNIGITKKKMFCNLWIKNWMATKN